MRPLRETMGRVVSTVISTFFSQEPPSTAVKNMPLGPKTLKYESLEPQGKANLCQQ